MSKQIERDKRKEKSIIKILVDGVRKKLHNLTDDRNNGHVPVILLPESCIPSGMCKYNNSIGTVVIKDLWTAQYVEESVNHDLDIISEQFEYAIEDIYQMKSCVEACKGVYSDFSEDEVLKETMSVQMCWQAGKKFVEEDDV